MLSTDVARLIVGELARREKRKSHKTPFDGLFAQQRAFFSDPAQFKAALCTRRAGKSHTVACLLYHHAKRVPNVTALYIALTRDSAKEIIWPVLTALNDTYSLGGNPVESALTMEMPNGAKIRCVGADMKNFIDRLRGPAYSIAVIDEAQSFGSHIKVLIDDVLEAALGDHRGPCCLMGTPGPVPQGIFYDATERGIGGYSVHKWSIHDNPHFPDSRGYIDGLKRRRQWTDENPTFQREYLGRWVVDLDALVYRFKRERNTFDKLPSGHEFHRILSVDYGWNDQTAFAIVAYSPTYRKVFVEHVEGESEMVPSAIAARIEQLRERYRPIKIVADTGGLGKSITEEFIQRYRIPITPAEKTEKLTAIALLNGDFIDKNCFVHESLTKLHEQYEKLSKGEDGKEDPSLPNDLCDAVLYGFREAKHYLGEPKEPEYPAYSREALEQEARRMLEREIEREDDSKEPWWAID